jgi:ATP-binding cassette subfamily C protein PrsD
MSCPSRSLLQKKRSQLARNVLEFNPLSDLLKAAPGPIGVLFGLSVISNLLMLTGSIFMLQVYDRVLPSRSMPTLIALTTLVVLLFAFYALIEWLRARIAARLGALIDERFSVKLFEASVRLRLQPEAGLGSDPVRDMDSLRQFVSGMGPISLLDLPWMPIYLGLAFVLHPLLGWLATGGAVAITTLLVVNELTSRRPARSTAIASIQRNALTDGARSNAEAIMAMGMLGAVSERWAQSSALMVRSQQVASDYVAFFASTTKGFRFLLQSVVLAAGAYLVIEGQITAGLMIATSILTSRALAPVEMVVAHWRGFVAARQATTRIREALARSAVSSRSTQLPLPTRTLSVAGLATAPDLRMRPLASGVDFRLEAGDGLGIIGMSGSGKSSVARAITGIWPVLGGEIRLDGSERQHFDPAALGRSVGYMPQNVELLDGTVAENICRFGSIGDVDGILGAARAAGVHELITSLPDGYDTRVGDGGSVLSAGQRQRIGLARALYGDPFLIVLDEPNSNLDSEGDGALTRALIAARERGAIIVVIAHRPSAIMAVNKLLFMQEGRQFAFGDKERVLRETTRQPTVVETRNRSGNEHRDLESQSARPN